MDDEDAMLMVDESLRDEDDIPVFFDEAFNPAV